MKILWKALLGVLFASILSACGTPSNAVINPGDTIGDFLITTGPADQVKCMYELDESDVPSTETEVLVPLGTKLVVTYGFYDDSYSGKLDEIWADKIYSIEINDRPVNLEAFGTIEKKHPVVGTMRFYNVVVEANEPGQIKVRHVSKTSSGEIDETLTLTFVQSNE